MGSWFSNIHIRTNGDVTEDVVRDYICKTMAAQQYLPVGSERDADAVVAIISGEGDPWVSLYSELFSHGDPESFAEVARPISADLHTDVLGVACFDSDHLYLNLIHAEEETNAWVGIGSAAGLGITRRTGLKAWKKKVLDYPAFCENAKKKYICAEEFLAHIQHCLGLSMERSATSIDYLKKDGYEDVSYLYFRMAEELPSGDPSRLEICYLRFAQVCFDGKENCVMAVNVGGRSKGLSVYFLGPYVEKDEITFSNVCIQQGEEAHGIQLTKEQLPDGQWAYSYHDPHFAIPLKMPKKLPKEKRFTLEKERMIKVWFVPHGEPRKMLDITVALVPHGDPSGGAEWNVWRSWGSKKAFIQHHNKISKLVRNIEPDPNEWPPFLKEEDHD